MRYTVRFYDGVDIINELNTNSLSAANICYFNLVDEYGSENVWVVDAIQEILAG